MRRLCLFPIVCLTSFLCVTPGPAEAKDRYCQPDRPLVRLLIRMNLLAHRERDLSAIELRMLSSRLRELQISNELSELRVTGTAADDQPVGVLINAVNSVLAAGKIQDPDKLTTAVTNVTMMLRDLCGSGTGDSREDGLATEDGEGDASLALERQPKKTVRNTFTLFFLLLGGVAGLYLLRFAFVKMFAFVFRRMACRMTATAAMGLDLFDGHVTILGRRGCSFIPTEKDGRERMLELAEQQECILIIGLIEVAGEIEEIGPTAVAIQFDQVLPRGIQDQLLAASKSPPHHVRTVRRRRSEDVIWRRDLERPDLPLQAMR